MGGRSTVVGFCGAAGSGVAVEAGDSGEDAKGEDSNESSGERVVGSVAGFSADGGDCGFVSSARTSPWG
jgi:hypothetical protein